MKLDYIVFIYYITLKFKLFFWVFFRQFNVNVLDWGGGG